MTDRQYSLLELNDNKPNMPQPKGRGKRKVAQGSPHAGEISQTMKAMDITPVKSVAMVAKKLDMPFHTYLELLTRDGLELFDYAGETLVRKSDIRECDNG